MVSIGIRIGIPQGTGSGGGTASPAVARPTITSPTEAAADQSLTLTLTSSAFAVTNEGTDTHASSDWQISDDIGFSNIVEESLADATNKTSYTASGLSALTEYWVRVRHNGTTYGASGWSTAVSFTTAAAPAYDTDAQAFFDAMGTAPNDAVKTAVDDLITTLKSDGIWSQLDALWPLNMPTLADSLINMKDPTGTAATAVNSPTHTPYVGIQGDGSTSYVNSNYTPSTDATNFTVTDASIGIHSATDRTYTTHTLMGGRDVTNSTRILFNPKTSSLSNRITYYFNSESLGQGNIQATGDGFIGLDRVSTVTTAYKDSTAQGAYATSSAATLMAIPLYIGAYNYNNSATSILNILMSALKRSSM